MSSLALPEEVQEHRAGRRHRDGSGDEKCTERTDGETPLNGHREEESLAKSTALNTRRWYASTFSAMAAAAFAHTRGSKEEFGERTGQGF